MEPTAGPADGVSEERHPDRLAGPSGSSGGVSAGDAGDSSRAHNTTRTANSREEAADATTRSQPGSMATNGGTELDPAASPRASLGELPPVKRAGPKEPRLSTQMVLPEIAVKEQGTSASTTSDDDFNDMASAESVLAVAEADSDVMYVDGGHQEVGRYFRRHGVVKLFKEMATNMLLNTDSDPYDIMLERLSRKEPWDHL
eukprot:m.418342 g.418342  ORF g.418342 m.418342 type:complete len:201 (+) comp30881_c0_seq1:53-655(+)